ncbi:MAG TPA: hypothetical protein VK616_14215 [Flavitalea sp.]|nr:hypothetical protein [Flavitalea sp.]
MSFTVSDSKQQQAIATNLFSAHTSVNEEFIRLLKKQDPRALSLLYDKYSPVFYGSITRLIPQEDQREAVLIKAFLNIIVNINKYDAGKEKFFSWMFAIVQKAISDWHED